VNVAKLSPMRGPASQDPALPLTIDTSSPQGKMKLKEGVHFLESRPQITLP